MIERPGHPLRGTRVNAGARRALWAIATSVAVLSCASGAGAGPAVAARTGQAAPVSSAPGQPTTPPVAFGYRAPVSAPLAVVAAFDPPADMYAAGHRGVDLALAQGRPVLAAGAGTVTFAGSVGGRSLLVIAHSDGIRTEYEPVVPVLRAGQPVVSGQVVGQLRGKHANCGAVSCLHWGARRGDEYIDPMGLLDRLGVVRLVQ